MLYKRSLLKNVSKFTDKHKKQPSGVALSKEKMFLKILQNSQKKHLFRSLFFKKIAGWKPETFRSSHWRCSLKQGALKNFVNVTENNLCWSLFNNVTFLVPATLSKKTATQVLSCEICNHFKEHLRIST